MLARHRNIGLSIFITVLVITVLALTGLPMQSARAQVTGACCFVPGLFDICIDSQTQVSCEGGGSTYLGDNSECVSPNLGGDCSTITLPVELVSFSVTSSGDGAVLAWETASETNNAGFSVERELGSQVFAEIGFVDGNGTTTDPKEYRFVVENLDPGLHRFRLKQIDFDGAFDYSPIVEAAATVPDRFVIESAYPNPFNPSTTIRFAVAAEQNVTAVLVNATGQTVRTLFNAVTAANEMQTLVIDASALPSGTYLVRFEGKGISATEQIVLAK